MRKEKSLVGMLRSLVELLAEESARNPEFSSKIDSLLSELPEKTAAKKKGRKASLPDDLPDIYSEWIARGEGDFRLWLRDQPILLLRAIIRSQDLDATRRTAKWKEAEKLADFITESLQARQSRGSAFIGRGTSE